MTPYNSDREDSDDSMDWTRFLGMFGALAWSLALGLVVVLGFIIWDWLSA